MGMQSQRSGSTSPESRTEQEEASSTLSWCLVITSLGSWPCPGIANGEQFLQTEVIISLFALNTLYNSIVPRNNMFRKQNPFLIGNFKV